MTRDPISLLHERLFTGRATNGIGVAFIRTPLRMSSDKFVSYRGWIMDGFILSAYLHRCVPVSKPASNDP